MRGSESAATCSPVISFSCDSTLRVRSLMALSSQLHELLAPVQNSEFLVVQERSAQVFALLFRGAPGDRGERDLHGGDRKSTRLNSSHANISYAVFCLKKKKNNHTLLSPI